jgi:hypothetical protein
MPSGGVVLVTIHSQAPCLVPGVVDFGVVWPLDLQESVLHADTRDF